ncbi:hypothetical protein NEIMUCOT_03844 [Neisseria mucosa ATCC 25996]|uniref:Uncharacterized protein n=1 Tax=Neisseria mucosa (strain ATCC 25996 / DSM 4631 / NCTC 10774 / M26) TaxID=546266 RepID=D2ZTA8_NEIM2|nr:hypothetical protein NEIMUCOT_03844 [Neisseria mucosa ATCC 25996]
MIRKNRSEENTGRLKPLFRRPLHRIGQTAFKQQGRANSIQIRTRTNHKFTKCIKKATKNQNKYEN